MWAVLVLLLASVAYAQQHVFCSSHRIGGADSAHIQQPLHEEGTTRVYSQVYLPWLVAPSTLNVTVGSHTYSLAQLALSQPWVEDLLLEHETLLAFELPKIELGGVATQSPSCKGSDTLQLLWHDSTHTRAFVSYPVLCNLALPQELGIDSHSSLQWGSVPRISRDGGVYGPSGGTEAMESIVARIAKKKILKVPLAIHFMSDAYYPVQAVTYHSCVSLDPKALLIAVQRRLGTPVSPPPNGTRIGVESSASLAISAPPLLPIRECVDEDHSGTCVARFGYVLLGTNTPIDVVADRNFLEPSDVAARYQLPTRFEPGLHRNAFKVKWFCVGKSFGSWNPVSWSLMGSRTTITKNVDRCGDALVDANYKALEYVASVQQKHAGERHLLSISSYPSQLYSYEQTMGCKRYEIVSSAEVSPTTTRSLHALAEVSLRFNQCPPGDYVRVLLVIEAELSGSRLPVLSEPLAFRCAKIVDAHNHLVKEPLVTFALDPLASNLPVWPLSGAFPIDGRAYKPAKWDHEIALPRHTKKLHFSTHMLYGQPETVVIDAEAVVVLC